MESVSSRDSAEHAATVVVDVDGTLALRDGRGPYDETRVGEDLPNPPVVACVQALAAQGVQVTIVSGRSEFCRADTEAWLAEHLAIRYDALHMRTVGDARRDADVKQEIYEQHILGRRRVLFVLDDRDQTVRRWRELGLSCFQVAPGNF